MTEAFLIIALLGLGWALASGFVLQERLRAVESTLARERAETAARLEELEGLAHDRWLTESASLGGQVAAMIQALEESAARAHGDLAARGARLEVLLRQADARLGTPAAPPAARPRETRADRVPASQTQVAAQSTPRQREVARRGRPRPGGERLPGGFQRRYRRRDDQHGPGPAGLPDQPQGAPDDRRDDRPGAPAPPLAAWRAPGLPPDDGSRCAHSGR